MPWHRRGPDCRSVPAGAPARPAGHTPPAPAHAAATPTALPVPRPGWPASTRGAPCHCAPGVPVRRGRTHRAAPDGAGPRTSRPTAPATTPENSCLVLVVLQRFAVARPVERRARVGLALRGYVAMALDPVQVDGRPGAADVPGELLQHRVLGIGIGQVVGALQLDADGEIVAAFAPVEARHPGVPGTVEQRH